VKIHISIDVSINLSLLFSVSVQTFAFKRRNTDAAPVNRSTIYLNLLVHWNLSITEREGTGLFPLLASSA